MIDMLIKDQLKCTTKMIGMIAISGRNRNPFFWPMIYSTGFSWIFLPRVHFQDVLCKQVETGGLKMRPSAIQPWPRLTWGKQRLCHTYTPWYKVFRTTEKLLFPFIQATTETFWYFQSNIHFLNPGLFRKWAQTVGRNIHDDKILKESDKNTVKRRRKIFFLSKIYGRVIGG